MKKLLFLILTSVSIYGQQKESSNENSGIVNAEASIIIPIGKLADKFDYAQSYGFWFKIAEENKLAVHAGFTTLFLQNPRAVNYTFKDSVYKIKSSKFGLDIGVRAVKTIPVFNKNTHLEIDMTIALHYLDYDFPKETDEDKKKSQFLPNTTVLFAPQMKYIYKNVGLKLQYRFAPVNLIEEMESSFGSSSISFGIVYKQ